MSSGSASSPTPEASLSSSAQNSSSACSAMLLSVIRIGLDALI
jgi:hypothetical protein